MFFFRPTFITPFINIYKLLFPVLLFLAFGKNALTIIKNNQHLKSYFIFYVLFFLWLFVPNMIEGDNYSIIKWLQSFPMIILFISLGIIMSLKSNVGYKINKIIVLFGVFTVAQYLILNLIPGVGSVKFYGNSFAGPMGILGNIASNYSIPGVDRPIYRLCGFFNEPSNASAFLFSSYFISKSIYFINKKIIWRYFGLICFIGGILAFSNAGYIALGCAAIFSKNISLKKTKPILSLLKKNFAVIFSLFIITFGLIGRYIVYTQEEMSLLARVSTGAVKPEYDSEGNIDYTGGRVDKILMTIETMKSQPWGVGYKPIRSYEFTPPAGAPFLWLLIGGIPGALLLGFRESVWVRSIRKFDDQKSYILQALIVIVVQHSIYGSWNNAFYYFLVAGLFSNNIKTR